MIELWGILINKAWVPLKSYQVDEDWSDCRRLNNDRIRK